MTRNELADVLEQLRADLVGGYSPSVDMIAGALDPAIEALRDVGVTDARVALIKRLVRAEQNLRIAYDGDMPFIHGCVELNEAVELVALEAALSPKAALGAKE